MEEQSTGKEGNQDITTADHRDDRDHRTGKSQGIKVNPIRHAEEDGYKDNVPVPDKRCRAFPARIPKKQEDRQHHKALVDIEPDLHRHHIHTPHQMLIVQAAHRTGYYGNNREEYPFVMGKVYPFFLSRRGKHIK